MSDNHDTIGLGPDGGGPPGSQPTAPSVPDEPGRNGRGSLLAVGIGTVMALIIGGGAYAFYQLDPLHFFRAGPQAAQAIPADALAYAAVDLDPAATQKINALRFLNHFPGFKEATDIKDERDDIRQTIFEDAINSLDCADVSYKASIEPWLGSKFGFAAMPANSGGQPEPVVALEVSDQSAASKTLDDLASCAANSGSSDAFGYAFTGGYVLLASSQGLAEEFANDAADASLADDSEFQADMDSLGETGVASAWVDIAGLIDEIPDQFDPLGIDPTVTAMGGGRAPLNLLKTQYQTAAATFRFSSDHVDVVTSVRGNTPHSDHGDNEIVGLPDSTVFAMSVAGGGDALAASWDDIMKAQGELNSSVDDDISRFEDQTGLNIPDDLETLLGDNLMLAVDQQGLDAQTLQSGDPSGVNAGVRFTGDAQKLNDLYDRIVGLLQDATGGDLPFSKEDFDKGLAIATNDSYARTLADLGGNLGDSQNFQSVIDDAASKQFVLFFNWDLIEDEILSTLRGPGTGAFAPAMQKVADNLEPLRAFGITGEVQGDYAVSHFVVSVD